MKTKTSEFSKALRVALSLLTLASGSLSAQTYTKTETITYSNNTAKWVLGQTASVTDSSTGLVQFAATYDGTYALPLTRSSFGNLQHTLTYNTVATLPSGLRGTLSAVKDGNNNITTLSSWKRGIPQSIVYADTKNQVADVHDSGWINSLIDETGAKTCYSYDAMGRLSGITYTSETVLGVCDTSKWDATNRILVPVASVEYGIPAGHWRETVTTGNAVKINYFDGMWRPLLVREYDSADQSATERFTRFQYDSRGRVAFKSYPSTLSSPTTGTWTDYEPLGRQTSITQYTELSPNLQVTLFSYNSGFTTTVTNPRGNSTTTSYMTYDQPSTDWPEVIVASESATTTIVRDVFGKPTAMTRSGSGATATRIYSYNSRQELCRSLEPETGATLFGYDNAGNLTWSAAGMASVTACPTDGMPTAAINLRKVSRTYDARNRLLALNFPDGNGNQTWTYHADGQPYQVTTANNGNTVTNAYTYNYRRLPSGESMVPDTLQLGWGMGYGYNRLGQVTTETYPAQVSVSYNVNALGQTTQASVGVPSLGTSTVVASNASYYPNGGVKQFTYGNGIVHNMIQNARQLPSRSTDGNKLDLATAFDENGNVASVTDYINAGVENQSKSMVYDNLDRLISATSPMFGTATYTYDTLDNLKRVNVTGGNKVRDSYYCYNAYNQLDFVRNGANCSSSPAVTTLGYDVQGNLSNKNGTAYTFDYGNRLRTTAGLTYRYDAQGRRVRLDNAGGSVKYSFYAQDGRLTWQRDEPGSKRISNVYFAGSLLAELSRPIGSNTETISYYHTDALGSPIAKTDASGIVIEKSEYEPYGLLDRPNDDRVGYTGHVMDSASGLTYMQQRYYDPTIGRFLSVDPVTADAAGGTNFNRYWYGNNNPYKFIDPDGRIIVVVPLIIEGCAASIVCGAAAIATGAYVGAKIGEGIRGIRELMQRSEGESAGESEGNSSPGTGTSNEEGVKKPTKEAPYPNNPDNTDFDRINGGKGAKLNPEDGSVWDRDDTQHGSRDGDADQWKRWPNKRSWEKGEKPNSIWPDGRIRK